MQSEPLTQGKNGSGSLSTAKRLMGSPDTEPPHPTSTVTEEKMESNTAMDGPSVATVLATDRTRLAHERTLMAWIRTATSLISFGFTIYKFFQAFQEKPGPSRMLNARHFALSMISIGIISLVFATWQHFRDMVALRAIHPEVPYSFATVVAGLIGLLGSIALIAVIFRQ